MYKHFFLLRTLIAAIVLAIFFAGPSMAADFKWDRFSGSKITVLMAEHPVLDGIRTLVDQFEKETGIKVNLQALAEDLYFDRMEIALRGSSKNANMDVYFMPMDSTAYTQFSNDLVHSLQGYLDDPSMTAPDYDIADIPVGFLNATRYNVNGKWEYHGIPLSFENYILFYNKDIVNQFLDGKVPDTMDGLIEAAKKVKEKSNGKYAGASLRGIRSDTLIDTVSGFVYNSWGEGGASAPYNIWFDNDWSKPRLTNDRIKKGLSNYAELMKAGPVNIQALDWPEASQLFKMGKAAFFIDASLFGPGFEDSKESAIAGKIGYAVMPVDNKEGSPYTAHWQWGFGIPKKAANPDAAWYFIQWMTNKTNEPAIGKLHGGAPRMSTWENEEYRQAFEPGYIKAVSAAMPNSRSSVVLRAGWSEFALTIIDAIQDMYKGDSPEKAVEKAQAKFEKLVK